jgi:hypothetical protein
MSNEKKITPDEVKIIAEVKTIYRAEGASSYYLDEQAARNAAANANKCSECGEHTGRWWNVCEKCRRKRDHERHMEKFASAPEWDGSYPVCLGDEFFWNEDDFMEHLAFNNIAPATITDLYTCSEIFASEALDEDDLIQKVEECMGGEEAECPAEIESAINEFIAKINEMKTPISYIGNKLVRMTDKQIDEIRSSLSSDND